MVVTEEIPELSEYRQGFVRPSFPSREGAMESRVHCAYNQTRECFLGLQVAAADLSPAGLAEKMKSLVLRSGEGLWITPFRGMQIPELPAPLDLIYLDEEGHVLEAVESFPTFRASQSGAKPATVLALPAHSIYSSQTQAGDQLVICVAEEMEQRLEGIAAGRSGVSVQSAVLLREQPLWSDGPGVLEMETPATVKPAEQRHEMELARPEGRQRAPKNWLERWWSPDPRKAPREPAPGLAAYYWNGDAPKAHGIRDISTSGIYVVTEERWYPGTLVLMTLQRTDVGDEIAERSIAVQTRAVRWGQDGVGLQFVLPEQKDLKRGKTPMFDGANRQDFQKFLQQLKKGKN